MEFLKSKEKNKVLESRIDKMELEIKELKMRLEQIITKSDREAT